MFETVRTAGSSWASDFGVVVHTRNTRTGHKDREADGLAYRRRRAAATGQRGLGRFLLRMQQYERLLRALLVDAQSAGTMASAAADRAPRFAHLQRQPSGQLLRTLLSSVLRPAPAVDATTAEPEAGSPPLDIGADAGHVRMRMGVEVNAVDLDRIEQDLQALHEVRNDLVHHLIKAFDVWTPRGCTAAQCEIDRAEGMVDEALHMLRRWAEGQTAARKRLFALIAGAQFASMVTVVAPSPSPLPIEALVPLLRDAERLAGPDGWTALDRRSTRSDRSSLAMRRIAAADAHGTRSWR